MSRANNKKKLRQEQRRVRALRYIREAYAVQIHRLREQVEGEEAIRQVLSAVLLAAAKGEKLEISRAEIRAQLGNAERDDVILYDETTGAFTIVPPKDQPT
mgnify:CR=1 FL=1